MELYKYTAAEAAEPKMKPYRAKEISSPSSNRTILNVRYPPFKSNLCEKITKRALKDEC